MPYTQANLEAGLAELRRTFQTSLDAVDLEYQDTLSWLEDIRSGLRTGQISAGNRYPLAPKTPARRPQLGESSRRGRNLSNVWSNDSSHSLENSTKSVSSSKGGKSSQKRSNVEAIEEEDDSPSKFMRLDSSENETRHLANTLQSSIEKFNPINHPDECVKVPVRHSKRISNKQSAGNVSSRTPLGELPKNKDLSSRISSVKEESEGNFSPVALTCDSPCSIMATDSTSVSAAAVCTPVKAPADSTTRRTTPDCILGSSTTDSSGKVFKDAPKGTHKLPLKTTRGRTAAIKAARKSVTRAKIVINKSSGLEDKSKSEQGHFLSKHVDKVTAAKHQLTASTTIGKGVSPASDLSNSDHKILKQGLSRIRTVSASSEKKVLGLTSFISKPVVPASTNSEATKEENLKKIAQRVMDVTKKKEDLIKSKIAEKAKNREQKRQRVLSARDEMERERALKVQLDRAAEKAAAYKAAAYKGAAEKAAAYKAEKAAAEKASAEKAAAQKASAEKAAAQKAAAEKAAAQKAAAEKAAAQKAAARKAAAEKAAAQKAAAQKAAAEKAAAQKAAAQKVAAQKVAAEKVAAPKAAALDRTSQGNELNQTYCVEVNKSTVLNQTYQVHGGGKILDQTYDLGTYDVTLAPEDRKPIPSKTEDDYGLDDVHTDDSSDDERKPKKVIPKWALDSAKLPCLQEQIEIPQKLMAMFFESKKCTPDLSKIFTHIDQRRLIRRSSAVWTSPKQ